VASGIDTFVEVGPGGVLTGLVKRIDGSVRTLAVSGSADLEALSEVMVDA
jgi:[acyl-carrier-protein] S-malonyltransferase